MSKHTTNLYARSSTKISALTQIYGKINFNKFGMTRERVHGFLVNFDESLKNTGLYYLQRDLQIEEAKSLFEAARAHGKAYFEDDHERQFTLIYQSDGTYDLEGR